LAWVIYCKRKPFRVKAAEEKQLILIKSVTHVEDSVGWMGSLGTSVG
jgi:hypothetical protein